VLEKLRLMNICPVGAPRLKSTNLMLLVAVVIRGFVPRSPWVVLYPSQTKESDPPVNPEGSMVILVVTV
jgi:hypothetical protein